MKKKTPPTMRRVYNNNNKMKMLRPASCVIRQPWQSKEHDDGAGEGGFGPRNVGGNMLMLLWLKRGWGSIFFRPLRVEPT